MHNNKLYIMHNKKSYVMHDKKSRIMPDGQTHRCVGTMSVELCLGSNTSVMALFSIPSCRLFRLVLNRYALTIFALNAIERINRNTVNVVFFICICGIH